MVCGARQVTGRSNPVQHGKIRSDAHVPFSLIGTQSARSHITGWHGCPDR